MQVPSLNSKIKAKTLIVWLGNEQRAELETGGLSGHKAQNLRMTMLLPAWNNCNICTKVFSRSCVIDGRVTVFLPPEMKGKTPNAYNWLGFEEGMVHA